MKNIQTILLLAAFVTSALCFNGYDQVTVFGNDDAGACLLTLKYSVGPNAVTFTETVQNPNQDCTYQNLTFKSLFWKYNASGSIALVQNPANLSQWKGKLTWAMLVANNGTACANVQPHGSIAHDIYVCKFAYGWNRFFNFHLRVDPTTNDFVADTGAFLPVYAVTGLVAQNSTTVWKTVNPLGNDIVGLLYRDCSPSTWSTNIPSGSNEFYVTGSILSSSRISLQSIFDQIHVYSVVVRKRADPSKYRTRLIDNFAFNDPPINGVCSDVDKTYSQIVGGMNYCSAGCEVSIYMEGQFSGVWYSYILRTSGFTYGP